MRTSAGPPLGSASLPKRHALATWGPLECEPSAVDGDVFKVLDVLAKDVGVIGVFSDWPATTTYYANCMGL